MLLLKDWNYKTLNTDTLNLDENKYVYKKNYLWRIRFSEILKSEACTKWVKWRELKNYELMKSQCKNWKKIVRQYKNSPLSCGKCKIRWILWVIRENFKKWNQITVGDYLTFPVNLQWCQVLVPCWASTNVYLLTHGIHRDYKTTFLVINFLRSIHPEIIIKESTLTHHKKNEDQFHQPQGRGLFFSQDKQSGDTIPMPTFARRPSTVSSVIPVEFPQNSVVGPQRQQIWELQFDKFPVSQSFLVWKIRFKNQATTCFDFPSEAMLWIKEVEMIDSLQELKSSRLVCGKNFPNFEVLDVKIASALKKIKQNSYFKKKVSLEEQKAQKRGPVSTRKTDRFHDLRLLSSHWCSWYRSWLRWFTISLRWCSGIRYETGWNSIIYDQDSIR